MVHMVDDSTGEIVADVDLEALTEKFPQSALKKREGARGKIFTYVDGTTVIHRLIEATHNQYSFSVDKYWSQDNTRLALVTLTITGLGSRSHIGVQAEQAGQGEDALAKGAITDGLKKAATLFGVGLELYGPDLNAGETQVAAPRPPDATRTPNAAPARPQPQSEASAPRTDAQDSRIPEKYPRVDGDWNIPSVVAWMQEAKFSDVTDFGTAIKAAQAWGKQKFGITDIIKHDAPPKPGKERYGNGTYPSAVVEAVSYWFDQEAAKPTAAPQPQEDDDFDSVPF